MDLSFYFSRDSEFILERTFCGLSSAEKIESIRAKSVLREAKSFQWTRAVKALMLLFVGDQLSKHRYVLFGGKGTAAYSLAYALDRKPLWLFDMFSVDVAGRPNIQRAICTTNIGRKKGRSVSHALRKHFKKAQVKVLNENGVPLSIKELKDLFSSLSSEFKDTPSPINSDCCVAKEDFRDQKKGLYADGLKHLSREIYRSLCNTYVFFRPDYIKVVRTLTEDRHSRAISGRTFSPTSELDIRLSSRGIKSYDHSELVNLSKGLRSVQWKADVALNSSVLFQILKDDFELDITLTRQSNQHGQDLLKRILSEKYEDPSLLINLGIRQYLSYLQHDRTENYVPLMFLPSFNFKEVGRAGHAGAHARFLYLYEDSDYLTDELIREGYLNPFETSLISCEPDSLLEGLLYDMNSVSGYLWFPHYIPFLLGTNYLVQETQCMMARTGMQGLSYHKGAVSILLAHKSIIRDNRGLTLITLLRNAWLKLVESPASCQVALKSVLDGDDGANSFMREIGMTPVSPIFRESGLSSVHSYREAA